MKVWQTTCVLALLLGSLTAYAQKPTKRMNEKRKTIRLHIDGFTKSKSGAV